MNKLPAIKTEKIRKPSAMIQTNVKELSLIQRKLINFMIYITQNEGDKKRYTTDVRTLKTLCNIRSTENRDLKRQFKSLREISIEFNYLDKDKNDVWEVMSVVSAARFTKDTGKAVFEIPYMLREKILKPNIYAPLNIILIAGLKSKYSIVLYELLRDYLDAPVFPELSIKQFRNLLGLEDHQYRVFQNFKKRVLDRAVDEINQKTDIRCSYTLTKEHGNKYSLIAFRVKKNKKFKLPEPVTLTSDNDLCLLPDETKIPRDVLNVIPKKYRITEVFQIIEPYLNEKDMLASNIRYTALKHRDNFIAYLKKALQEDYARSAREVQGNIDRAEAKKEEQAAIETRKLEEEEKRAEAVITWRAQASPELLLQIQERATQEVKEEHPEISKNFLGIPTRIRTDEIIVNEYLNKPAEPDQEELVLFELEQDS